MHADLRGALEQINSCYQSFEHRGKRMTKEQVFRCLAYGIGKGYKTTSELSDEEVDNILLRIEKEEKAKENQTEMFK